jgi:hypothetical protein
LTLEVNKTVHIRINHSEVPSCFQRTPRYKKLTIVFNGVTASAVLLGGIEPVLAAWKSNFSILYFQHLQNRFGKMHVHATHIVVAVP